MSSNHRYAVLTIDGEPCQVTGYSPWHAGRKRIEQFIADRFLVAHGAHLHQFMPLLVALESATGEVLAVAGVRSAQLEPLFLEHYLNAPVERIIAQRLQVDSHRQDVVEVGNLAAVRPGSGRYLFAALTDLLVGWNFRWLACTGVAGVVNVLRRLGIDPVCVAPALPDKIPGGAAGWGNYYDKQPQVMVGEIQRGRRLVEKCGLLQSCGYRRVHHQDVLSA
jgi:hypothetical protein